MPLTRLDNLISSKTGKYLYVSPDDFNATDALDNRGNSPLRPFVTIQRAFLEAARFSYLPNVDNDRFDQFTIMLSPGNHYIDNRPGIENPSDLPVFQFNQATQEWEANTNVSFDLSDPNNILYKFNGRDGGATIPRGTSLVGTDLRRTQVRALYVPDPADKDIPRTALFNVTGGCYFWQFTILDGDLEASSPLYNVGSPVGVGKVYTQPNNTTNLAIPEFSHHKITNFVFADKEDLGLLYRKIARVFSDYQPAIDDVYVEGSNTPVTDAWSSTASYQVGDRVIYNQYAYVASAPSANVVPGTDNTKWNLLVIRGREFDYRVQENRIVGPLSDAVRLDEVTITDSSPAGLLTVKVRTKINHGFFPGQYVAISNNGLNTSLNGVFKVTSISQTDPKEFEYKVATTATGLGLISGATYTSISSPALDTNATVQAEVDSVESASPYVFNVSIRSTWGICGIWADGRKATGFKSMVIAQYTGVSLQKDDRAFIRYDEFSNTWNQAPLTDAFATTPYHIKGDAYWKDDWRNFHVRASDDSFIQNVSIFAVGFADHFLLESGGDMSITNSNSNFGNTSMHSKGFKGFAFSQDKGGYITDIIPPKSLSTLKTSRQQYYTLDVQLSRASSNTTRLYLGSEDARNPEDRPAASIGGYRIGAKRNEKLYVKLDTSGAKSAELVPSGFKKWVASLSTLTPSSSRSVENAATLFVASSTNINVNDFVKVDNEFFKVTAKTATSLTVSRAQLGTQTSDHISGSTVTKYVQNSPASTVVNETVDATETIFTLTSTTGFIANGFVSITNNQTSINETVRVVSVEGNDIVVQRGQLGTVAVSQPVGSTVTATFLSNTYSPASPAVTTTLTERYPRIVPASNASQRDYNLAQDAANLIDANKTFIQSEAFGYILEKYPYLQNRPYVNPNITAETGRYRDASNLIKSNRQEIIDYAFAQMQTAFPSFTVPGGQNEKCKRDIGYIVDAIADDLYDGGNIHMVEATKAYFDANGALTSNGLSGEQEQSIFAFNRAKDWAKKAISNLLTNKSLLSVTSITSSGTTVTVTCSTPHNLTAGTSVTVGGAQQTAYNGKFTVLSAGLTSTQFRYTAASAPSASPATGAVYVSTITIDPVNDDPNVGRFKDAKGLIDSNRQEIIDTAWNATVAQYPSISSTQTKCKRDIGYIVDSIAQDLFWGGNEFTVGAVREYFTLSGTPLNNGLVGEEVESVYAFNQARNLVKSAITNQLTVKNLSISAGPAVAGGGGGNIANTSASSCADVRTAVDNLFAIVTDVITAGTLNNLPTVDNGDWDCANVRNTIDTLVTIINTALKNGNLNQLPVTNVGQWSQVSEASKCKRDIGYIVEAVTSDLRLGGNENTINAAEAYYTAIPLNTDTTDGNQDGFTLDYIENERPETIDAYNYVRNLAISAMRNHNTYINNASTTNGSPIVTVASTIGLAVGMRIRSVNNIPANSSTVVTFNNIIPSVAGGAVSDTYIKKIGDGQNGLASNQIELGREGSKFDTGVTVSATSTSTTVKLYVELLNGTWSNAVEPITDSAVIQDYEYLAAGDPSTGAPGGECASVANSLVNYFNVISTIINNGVGTVPRVSSSLNTGTLAQRSTLFTLTEYDSNNTPTTNPHQLETGTPVRLVPRAKYGTNPDKRIIRLPKGFDTNTTYYTISPGRRTDPFDYSNSVGFDGANQQTLMLATSEENAAAGIYIYSSETDSVDPNVEIDVYQYVLDLNYDLHQYQTTLATGSSTEFETDRPHVFDKPANNVDPQKVFFRVASDIVGSSLPTLSSSFGGTVVSGKQEYYVRYVSSKRFTVHQTFADARDNINPVTFQTGSTSKFYTFASKRRSPLKYAPEVGSGQTDGCWYLESLSATNTIINRLKQNDYTGRIRTTDTYFERVEDNRTKEDRVYRLRYVIPKNLKTVRDPLRGFVIKVRNDEKRRLLPQKILLKPTGAGAPLATFNAPLTGERLGLTITELTTLDPNFVSTYDPGPQGNPKRLETDSKISFTIQSARKKRVGSQDYIQLTVFDIGVDAEAYKTKIFTTVKISAPQGGDGSFVESIPNSNNSNKITWSGNSSGTAYVHAYFAYENNYYLILKDFTGNSVVDWDPNTATTFTQGSVTATLLDQPNAGRSDIKNFLYVVEGANVYTMTPGDTLNDDNGVSYTIASVEDVEDMESTFYIFDINTIRRRIPGQQDGVYYLTCLRGDIRPYPTGSGVGENFRNFRFSQPVSKLYPEFYKNDPEWYKGIDPSTATLLDPPATVSAADNYVHGLVTVNDSKGSVTKEMVLDLIQDPGSGQYTFSQISAAKDNRIQAQPGSASAGSESRRIPICGDSEYPTEGKLYVELRRPSIARSGNHTFEYLGFGPGNYSTGFPARQEVVLTDVQDFYAQAKREDAGIVFYTGLNSNGDLYIGNRKINAITGEETFLEKAILVESSDEADNIGTLVTTFDTAVTFNDIITINGGDGTKESFFNSPVVINNTTQFNSVANYPSLKIATGEGTPIGYDGYLEYNISGQRTGDILLHQNTISAAVFDFNPRGYQDYTIRTALSNRTPDFANTFGSTTGGPSQLQNTNFGTLRPLQSGDIQFKGEQTLFTGSLGWIYANDYIGLATDGVSPQIQGIQGSATGTIVRLNWVTGVTNASLGITSSTQIRIIGAINSLLQLNGVWSVYSGTGYTFSSSNNYVDILTNANLPIYNIALNSGKGYPVNVAAQPSIVISRSQSAFKEFGVIGAEALRTETSAIGDYKLGINTVARSSHSAYQTAFVSAETTPRANLDVVGNAFISGKKVLSYLTESGNTKTETTQDNAFLVGGDSANPSTNATLRVMTANSGRVGINVDSASLDRALVVGGSGRVTGDFAVAGNLQLDGGNLNSGSGSFTIASSSTTLTLASNATSILIGNSALNAQTVNLGNNTSAQTITIGDIASTTTLNIHRNSTNSVIDIGSVANNNAAYNSQITIGGAFANTTSTFQIKNRQTKIDGDLEIGSGYPVGTNTVRLFTQAATLNLFDTGGASVVNFARNAAVLSIASDGGTTTINNSLAVKATATVDGSIVLNGGLNSGTITVSRGAWSTAPAAHSAGSIQNRNIDFYKYTVLNKTLDTQGAQYWGGTSFQDPTTSEYYLPINELSTTVDFAIGDYILVDRGSYVANISSVARSSNLATITTAKPHGLTTATAATIACSNASFSATNVTITVTSATTFTYANTGSTVTTVAATGTVTQTSNQTKNELLRVTELTNLSNGSDPNGFRIRVARAQDGTTIRTDHPDDCPLVKFVKFDNSSWLLNSISTAGAGTSTNIDVAEFGGVITTNDYIRIDDNEIVKVTALVTTDIQSLSINDGGLPSVTQFKVESTTGNTILGGNLGVGLGFNKLTVAGATGNTNIAGTLTVENTIILNGSTTPSTQYFRITDGALTPLTKFQVDTANGNTIINGGNLNIYGSDGTTSKLSLNNSSGDLSIAGVISTAGSGTNSFVGDVSLNGTATYGGNLTVNSNGVKRFKVNAGGAIDLGGIDYFYSSTGARKWLYVNSTTYTAVSNINYFVTPTSNTLIKLPASPTTGDMIRFVDIAGNLTYNISLILRAPTGVLVQGDASNTGTTILGSLFSSALTGYDGGELVIQTPNAGFGLVYAGPFLSDGTASGIPSASQGWWLMEI